MLGKDWRYFVQRLSSMLKDPDCALTTLNLSNNHFDDHDASVLAEQGLRYNTSLENLHLGGNSLGLKGHEALFDVLENYPEAVPQLRDLNLKGNKLFPKCGFGVFGRNSQLDSEKRLRVHWHSLGSEAWHNPFNLGDPKHHRNLLCSCD